MKRTDQARLLRAARAAARRSYSPFSNFPVGAAVLTDKGIFSGTNVENSSYGLTMCAERVAMFTAASAGARRLLALAVFAPSAQSKTVNRKSRIQNRESKIPAVPCGACLQVASEFGDNPEVVLSDGRTAETTTLRDLLPRGFRLRPGRA